MSGWAAHGPRVCHGGGLDWPPRLLVWPWCGTWLGTFLLCTCLWWLASPRGRCVTFSVCSGSSPTLAVSMCLLGRPAFSRPPRKWPALAHELPWWPRYGKWLRFSVTPFGEISWRFGVASGSSLCRTAEGLPRCSDRCLLSSVTLTDFLFFLQPWARWPSVWRGSPGVTPAIWGGSVSCWGFYVFWGLQEVLGRQRDGVWVPGGWLGLESVLGWPRPCRWHDTLLSFSRANGG